MTGPEVRLTPEEAGVVQGRLGEGATEKGEEGEGGKGREAGTCSSGKIVPVNMFSMGRFDGQSLSFLPNARLCIDISPLAPLVVPTKALGSPKMFSAR